jgi:hypothetical protein
MTGQALWDSFKYSAPCWKRNRREEARQQAKEQACQLPPQPGGSDREGEQGYPEAEVAGDFCFDWVGLKSRGSVLPQSNYK